MKISVTSYITRTFSGRKERPVQIQRLDVCAECGLLWKNRGPNASISQRSTFETTFETISLLVLYQGGQIALSINLMRPVRPLWSREKGV
jgi:hypothetical protein